MPYHDEEAAPRCRRRGNHGPDDCQACEAEQAYWREAADQRAWEEAHQPPLPTDAEVGAMLAELAPDVTEFAARERAKEIA